ncbi:carboxylating nicotinate-nucleotide diphosphorylase [bacterium]|nr:carboxylating nicotinate-nucleotide diphosphorylase [bacterium]
MRNNRKEINLIIKRALAEDVGASDITTEAVFPDSRKVRASLAAKSRGILAGIDVAKRVFKMVDDKVTFKLNAADGTLLTPGIIVAEIKGDIRGILTAERTALNILGRMSGIASLTGEFVNEIKGTKAKILDTRKTVPGLRILEKYAVSVGGGYNHRFGLDDMFLIKDNHIDGAGGIAKAVGKVISYRRSKQKKWGIIVEARTVRQVKIAVNLGVDRIMLDNMDIRKIRRAVKVIDGRKEIEVSGNVNLHSVSSIAECGVDYISVGYITHSARSFDFSLLVI